LGVSDKNWGVFRKGVRRGKQTGSAELSSAGDRRVSLPVLLGECGSSAEAQRKENNE
jgi:hypothetical protein